MSAASELEVAREVTVAILRSSQGPDAAEQVLRPATIEAYDAMCAALCVLCDSWVMRAEGHRFGGFDGGFSPIWRVTLVRPVPSTQTQPHAS